MTKEQIADAIANNTKCTYHDCKYTVYGYQRAHIPGSVGVIDSMLLVDDTMRCTVYAPIKDVILEDDNGQSRT